MDISELVENSLKKPLEDKNTLLKISILTVSTILILPIFVLYGYILELVSSASEKGEIPPLQNLGELFIEGFKMFVVFLPLMLAVYIPLSLFALLGEAGFYIGVPLAVLAGLAVSYVSMWMVAIYSVERDWRKVYSRETVERTLNADYLKMLLILVAVYYGVSFVTSIIVFISFITIIGWIFVIPLASGYMMLVFGYMVGRIHDHLK